MIDRFLSKFFGAIDNFFEWLKATRCKCKSNKGKIKNMFAMGGRVDKPLYD